MLPGFSGGRFLRRGWSLRGNRTIIHIHSGKKNAAEGAEGKNKMKIINNFFIDVFWSYLMEPVFRTNPGLC